MMMIIIIIIITHEPHSLLPLGPFPLAVTLCWSPYSAESSSPSIEASPFPFLRNGLSQPVLITVSLQIPLFSSYSFPCSLPQCNFPNRSLRLSGPCSNFGQETFPLKDASADVPCSVLYEAE